MTVSSDRPSLSFEPLVPKCQTDSRANKGDPTTSKSLEIFSQYSPSLYLQDSDPTIHPGLLSRNPHNRYTVRHIVHKVLNPSAAPHHADWFGPSTSVNLSALQHPVPHGPPLFLALRIAASTVEIHLSVSKLQAATNLCQWTSARPFADRHDTTHLVPASLSPFSIR
jgi:hypothetical protein